MEGKKYKGPKTSCTYCGKNLLPGEIISVSDTGEPFCYSDAGGGCVAFHVLKTGKPVLAGAMMFAGD